MLGYNRDMKASVIMLENTPFNAVNESQQNRLNLQSDVQMYSHGMWDIQENVSAVRRNCSPDHNPTC